MNVKFLLKIFNKFLKLFDLKIINENNFKNHPDYIVLIKSLIENQNPTIFDVGAHHGESVENFNSTLTIQEYSHLNLSKCLLNFYH